MMHISIFIAIVLLELRYMQRVLPSCSVSPILQALMSSSGVSLAGNGSKHKGCSSYAVPALHFCVLEHMTSDNSGKSTVCARVETGHVYGHSLCPLCYCVLEVSLVFFSSLKTKVGQGGTAISLSLTFWHARVVWKLLSISRPLFPVVSGENLGPK